MYKALVPVKYVISPALRDALAVVRAAASAKRATTYLSSVFTKFLKNHGIAGFVVTVGIGKPCSDDVVSGVDPAGCVDVSDAVGASNVIVVPLAITAVEAALMRTEYAAKPPTVPFVLLTPLAAIVAPEGTFVPLIFQPAANSANVAVAPEPKVISVPAADCAALVLIVYS